ncbi:MAG: thiamine pyrophosphate-dependent enzyme [Dehalococcoidia bacterium]|nr:thiamine pyrophosphate-dependent enzyme [Dehalococcoidia bacterium]
MVTIQDYPETATAWCPGCGNFGILAAVRRALVELELPPHRVLLVSGIGQAGKLPHYAKGNVLNELHGRALPAAIGAKLANAELTVLVHGGDGDGYGEGGNHFLHAMHRNPDITYIVHNNQVYALTKGQTSPTSDSGYVSKTTPQGAHGQVNPLALAIASDCSFVARSFAGDIEHLANIIGQAVRHRGFALVDVLQPCVTFNHKNTYKWYRDHIYKLDEGKYDPTDRVAAFGKALEWEEKIPVGVLYRRERPTLEEQFPALKAGPLVKQPIDPLRIEGLFDEFM